MSAEVLVIRFPNGDAEIYSGSRPSTGDKLTRRDTQWIVAQVASRGGSHTAVTVMPVKVQRDPSWPTSYEFVRLWTSGEAPVQ